MVVPQTRMLLKKQNLKSCLMLCAKVIIVCVNCLKNIKKATLISKSIQTELLSCVRKYILEYIKKEINEEGVPSFGVVADKMTDCANWQQLGTLIRYIYQQEPVETLIEYVKCDNIIDETIANLIIESLKSNCIDISYCPSRTYGGAGNMAGKQNRAAQNFIESIILSLCLSRIKPSLNESFKGTRSI